MIGADGAHSVVRRFLFESSPQDGELLESPVVTSMTCAKFDRDVSLATRNLSPLAHITLNPNGLFTFASSECCLIIPSISHGECEEWERGGNDSL